MTTGLRPAAVPPAPPWGGIARLGALALATGFALSLPAKLLAEDLPVLKIFATGGTIANTPDGRIPVDAILEELPEVAELADIRIQDITRVASGNLTWQDFIDVARGIEETIEKEPEVDGFIVTIGSNSAEEMAYFLNLVVDTDKPIVVTAAQRQRHTRSEDASRNFLDALRVAGTPEAGGMGALLVVNETIHPAREATKNVVSRVDSWDSTVTGALGIVSAGEVLFYRQPMRRHTTESEFSLNGIETSDDLPKVEIVYGYIEADPVKIDALVDNGTDGIVVAAFATGAPGGGYEDALVKAAEQGISVVISNRGTEGRMANRPEPYITADNLSPQKAHILLMMGLTVSDEPEELARIFAEY